MRHAVVTGSALAYALGAVGVRAAADEVVTVAMPSQPSGYRSPAPHRSSSGTPVRPYREPDAGHRPHQGEREKARRRRQMLKAKLKREGA